MNSRTTDSAKSSPWLFVCSILLPALLATLLASGCSLLTLLNSNNPHIGTGTMIVRYGSYVYRIGGEDASGTIRSTIMMAKINLDGSGKPLPLEWSETAALPEGRSFGAVFAARNTMYVLGGDNDSGPTSTIFATGISATDGTLGYDASRYWETSPQPLASPRSHMALAIYDGRIFLIGGRAGISLDNSIAHARFYESTGWPGQWYDSPQKLPFALYGSGAAILNGRLIVTGGVNSAKQASDLFISYALGLDGLLSDPQQGTLPKALAYPACVADGDSLLVAGGYDSTLLASETVYRRRDSGWTTEAVSAGAEGPSSAKAAGTIWFADQAPGDGSTGVSQISGLTSTPDRLIVIPGSGMVPKGAIVYLKPEPGTNVRYRSDSNAVTTADPEWTSTTINANSTLSLRSFASDGSASEQVRMQYGVRTSSFFTWVSGDFIVKAAGADLDTFSVSDNLFNPSSEAYSTAWGRLNLNEKTNLALSFADHDSSGGAVLYSGRIKLTLYEGDLYSEVPDINGVPVKSYTTSTATQPILLTLNPGSYLLLIEDLDGVKGRTFGLAFRSR